MARKNDTTRNDAASAAAQVENEVNGSPQLKRPVLDFRHWQDYEGSATFDSRTAGDLYRASTGLKAILDLLDNDNCEQSAIASGHPENDVVLLPANVRTGLLSGAIVLADHIKSEFDRRS